jgi:hypothetical protein
MRFLKWLGYLVFGAAVVVAAIFAAARFHDGPLELIPGGPLEAGDFVTEPVRDWSFARDIATIELQLYRDETSRTVWILVDGKNGYIPCSLGFPPFKNWHKRADRDGRAILRIDGKKYRVAMKRIDDAAVIARLATEVGRKYGGAPGVVDTGAWFFALESRAG